MTIVLNLVIQENIYDSCSICQVESQMSNSAETIVE